MDINNWEKELRQKIRNVYATVFQLSLYDEEQLKEKEDVIIDFISSKLKEVLDECIGDKLPEDIDNYAYENYVGVGYIKHRQHCIEIKNKLNI